jgi:Outer membrane lipoprotein/Putative zinc-finger
MNRPGCKRSWQAEAVEDGRLSGEERASFERHAQTCRACADERRALTALREAAKRLPALHASPLGRRRGRQNLLGRANDVAQNARRPAPWRLAAVAAAALGVAVAMSLALSRTTPHSRPQRAAAVSAPTYEMRASSSATWHTAERGPTLRLALERGVFALHVDKLIEGQRFIANLPDGELEVRGTRFVVDVDGARTLRVSVSEGHVALRIRGRAERLLGPGQSWSPALASNGASNSARSASSAGEPSSAQGATSAAAKPHATESLSSKGATATSAQARSAKRASVPTSSEAADPAAAELDAAVRAYRDGDFAHAQQLFAAFEQKHPSDARAEDAAFLRAVACLRRGDRAGAQALARDYLKRYPNGLRREEAKRLLKP